MINKDKKSPPNKKNNRRDIYQGNIRLKIESEENHIEVSRFCDILKNFNSLRILSYNWSEKEGLNIIISLRDSIPLDEILLQIPQVKIVDSNKKSVTVVLNTNLSETSKPAIGEALAA